MEIGLIRKKKKIILALHAALPAYLMALLDWRREKELPYGVSQSSILAAALAGQRGGEEERRSHAEGEPPQARVGLIPRWGAASRPTGLIIDNGTIKNCFNFQA